MFQNLKQRKLAAITISIIYLTTIAIISIYIYQKLQTAGLCGINAICIMDIPLYYFIPLISSISTLFGIWVSFLLSEVEKESGEKCKIEEKEKVKEIINMLLDEKERKVYNSFEKESKQSQISKKLNMNRVEVHRILKRLEEKGLVERIKEGKVVKVTKKIL